MHIFFLVIFANIVLKWLSQLVIDFYLASGKTDEQLANSFFFNVAVVSYLLNTGMLLINATILAAVAVKFLLF